MFILGYTEEMLFIGGMKEKQESHEESAQTSLERIENDMKEFTKRIR